MNKPSLLLIGAGGHAMSCIDVIEWHGGFEIAGLVGEAAEVGREIFGYRVLGTDSELPRLVADGRQALVTVGQIKTSALRQRLFELSRQYGFRLPAIVSPLAYVSPRAEIGEGTIVLHGAIVNAGARIGRNCIINSRALVEHGAGVGDHCHVSTAAVLNGDVRIGEGSFVGSGSTIKEGVTLGRRCLVAMGVRVRHDHGDNTKLIG